jgi:hypothetical protein
MSVNAARLTGFASLLRGLFRARLIVFSFLELSMRVLSFLPRHDVKRRVEKALTSAQFVVETINLSEPVRTDDGGLSGPQRYSEPDKATVAMQC